jgi:hypothetical protein
MDRPERADYFRVFPRHMLMDEDYENLSREEWGSVFLLMLHQWAKGGTLPDDRRKLAWLARCTPDELDDLLAKWPKLEPVSGQPGRTGIPYLVREWDQVMSFYQEQRNRGKASAEARGRKSGAPDEPALNHGSTMVQPWFNNGSTAGSTNQDQDQDQDQDQEKTTTATRKRASVSAAKEGHRSPIADLIQDTDTEEESEREEEGEKRNTCPEAVKPPSGPAVMVLPCVGKGLKEWPVTQSLLDDWKDAYPGLDPLAEAKRMRLWLEQNPKRGKTYAGMGRFTTSWLSRAQDSARPSTPNQGANHGSATHRHARRDAALKAQLSDAGVQTLPGLPEPDVVGQKEPW